MIKSNFNFFSLGGFDEPGKNLYVLEHKDNFFIFDSGNLTPVTEKLGVNKVIPDMSWVKENSSKIKAIFITQADEEHIGSISYLLQTGVDCNVYLSPFTRYVAVGLLRKAGVRYEKIVDVFPDKEIQISDDISFSAFSTFSSMPNSLGFVINTPSGSFCHVQSFCFNNDKNKIFSQDIKSIINVTRNKKISLLSVYSNSPNQLGFTSPNHRVFKYFDSLIRNSDNRFFVSFYNNQYHQIISLVKLASELRRPIYFTDSDTRKIISFLHDKKLFSCSNYQVIDANEIKDHPNLIIIVSAYADMIYKIMTNIASNATPGIEINPESDIFISHARPVKGNERFSSRALDELSRSGMQIKNIPKNILDISASSEDIKMLINLINPENIVVNNCLYKEAVDFSFLAREAGISKNNIINVYNGDKLSYDNGVWKIYNNFIKLKEQYTDNFGLSDVASSIIDERFQMSADGVANISCLIDKNTKLPVSYVSVDLKGVTFEDATIDPIIKKISDSVYLTIVKYAKENKGKSFNFKDMRNNVRKKSTKVIEKIMKKKPVVLSTIIEI